MSKEGDEEEPSIVDKVKEYFLEAEDFETTFMGWAKDHCGPIDIDAKEMKLEYTELHQQFLEFFEKRMESFISENGSDIKTFYKMVKASASEDPDGDDSIFIQIMLAVTEFDVFMQMMVDAKKAVLDEEGHK